MLNSFNVIANTLLDNNIKIIRANNKSKLKSVFYIVVLLCKHISLTDFYVQVRIVFIHLAPIAEIFFM